MTNFLIWLLKKWVEKTSKDEMIIAYIEEGTIKLHGVVKTQTDDYFYKLVREVYLHTLEEKR